jgi:glutaredoxin-like protein NrdH
MKLTQVSGEDRGKIVLYALSTCVWCKKTKKLLNKHGVGYSYVDVDQLEGEDREKTIEEIKKWNPKRTFPTMVVNDKSCIVGYKEDQIKEAIGK